MGFAQIPWAPVALCQKTRGQPFIFVYLWVFYVVFSNHITHPAMTNLSMEVYEPWNVFTTNKKNNLHQCQEFFRVDFHVVLKIEYNFLVSIIGFAFAKFHNVYTSMWEGRNFILGVAIYLVIKLKATHKIQIQCQTD